MALHRQEDYDINFVQSLINNGIEEGINIEFKAGPALSKNELVKKEISKDISAFANSSGGIIIYGLNEINHKANSFSFIDGNVFSKEWLEQVINSTIQRNIEGLRIFPIRNNGKIEESIYVVQIPESLDAPHMNKDKKFYRRGHFESVAMEEYEVRNLYGRKSKSKLAIASYSISHIESYGGEVKFRVSISARNLGDIEESTYKTNSYFKNFLPTGFKISWDAHDANLPYSHIQLDEKRVKISNSGRSTIYPNETVNVSRFFIHIQEVDLKKAFELMQIEFKIFFSGGDDTLFIDFRDFEERYNESLKNL
jgi:hypothetical protein